MGKSIVIAEKPSVGRDYARVLGVENSGTNGYLENDKWIVTWTVGHLITMSYPEKYSPELKEWKLETLPIIPETYKYENIAETYEQFQIIKRLYNRTDIDAIYYAGDSGREGLYIQMLVRMMAGHNPKAKERVVWIDTQTDAEILRGIAEAKDLSEYSCLSDAGYMRAIEDFGTGINFSRLLSVKYAVMLNSGASQKYHKPISVGRVMTAALGMVVRREREIRNFRVTYFYRVAGTIDVDGKQIECEWRECERSKYYKSPKLYSEFGFLKEEDAKELIGTLNSSLRIDRVEKTVEHKNAPLFYNLAELQSDCSKKMHITPSETLKLAQSLYEMKCITYPRTDARVLSSAAAREIHNNLSLLQKGNYESYASKIVSSHWSLKSKYVDDSKITDHYAIIPTGVVPQNLSDKEGKVYDLICRRFLAVFYPPAEYIRAKIEAWSGNEFFSGTSKYLVNAGYYEVSGFPEEDEGSQTVVEAMNKLLQGNEYPTVYGIKKGETAPPKRYTAGSIVLAMENAGNLIEDESLREQIKANGIGTSATRAEVIDKLLRLNYIALNDKKQVLTPTNFGEMVYEVVDATIPAMLSPEITARWERGLEQIANGIITRASYEEQLYDYIRKECEKVKAMNNNDEILKRIRPFVTGRVQYEYKEFDPYNTKIKCPLCGDDVETTSWGFKCKSNISKTEGCSFVMGDILEHRLLTNELAELLHNGKVGPFYDFVSQKGKPFGAYLLWDNEKKKIEFELVEMPWEKTDCNCPVCGKPIMKQGKFYRCEGFIDGEQGCSFRIFKIRGKSISEKQMERLVKEGKTDIIKGFKGSDGETFDAFLVWNQGEKRIQFKYPEYVETATSLFCPICHGRVLSTPYGFKCENNVKGDENSAASCSFFCGTISGHVIKEKELQTILSGGETDLLTFKNAEKKTFEAKLYWDQKEERIAMRFEENKPVEIFEECPLCHSRLLKNKYGYRCKNNLDQNTGCTFRIGSIAGILIDEKQLYKLLSEGKTDLISGFKPNEKGKSSYSAYLRWDTNEGKIAFEFPENDSKKERSNYRCPACRNNYLDRGAYGYSCECGFRLNYVISSKELPDEQIRKLIVRGETDVISGFYSERKRKMFSAKVVIRDGKTEFAFPEKEN